MTYLENLKKKMQDNQIIAWLVVVFIALSAFAALYGSLKPLFQDIRYKKSVPLSILIEPHDPRFGDYGTDGLRMNWGGGSQSLYIETREPVIVPNLHYSQERGWEEFHKKMPLFTKGLLSRLKKSDQIVRLWEVIMGDGMRIQVNVSYDATLNEPTILIREWGIRVEEVETPKHGIYDWYRIGGGAAVFPIGGAVTIAGEGLYRINLWLERDGSGGTNSTSWENWVKQSKYRQYLQPGEPVFLDINVQSIFPESLIDNPKPIHAFHIQVYTKVLIKGVEYTIFSKNSARAVVLNGSNDWHEDDGEIVENSRPLTYFY